MKKILVFFIFMTIAINVWSKGPYIDNADGTITDEGTGLIWQKSDDGVERSLKEAETYCKELNLGGYSNWRLPSLNELKSLIKDSNVITYGSLLEISDINCPRPYYWTSTPIPSSANFTEGAFKLNFYTGMSFLSNSTNTNCVKCVLDIQNNNNEYEMYDDNGNLIYKAYPLSAMQCAIYDLNSKSFIKQPDSMKTININSSKYNYIFLSPSLQVPSVFRNKTASLFLYYYLPSNDKWYNGGVIKNYILSDDTVAFNIGKIDAIELKGFQFQIWFGYKIDDYFLFNRYQVNIE